MAWQGHPKNKEPIADENIVKARERRKGSVRPRPLKYAALEGERPARGQFAVEILIKPRKRAKNANIRLHQTAECGRAAKIANQSVLSSAPCD